jgi:ribosomal protein S18 acetylase RimI-like enzyme
MSARVAGSAGERFEVKPLRPGDEEDLAMLHLRAMGEYFLSSLGRGFLRRFYSEFCRHPFDYGVVARRSDSGRPVAFVVGTSDAGAHFRALYRRHGLYMAGSVLAGVLFHPVVRRGVLRRLDHMRLAIGSILGLGRSAAPATARGPRVVCPVRLLSIAVDPEDRGSGVARLASELFEAQVKRAGFSRVGLSVHADNERAISFYRKTGWNEVYRSAAGLWFEKEI